MIARTVLTILACACAAAFAADVPAPLQPVTVCEILAHPDVYAGKPIVVVGRFSFREYGRFLSEKGCVLHILLDSKNGPVPPAAFSVDVEATNRKLADVRKTTNLASFRFGSSEYDRWAMVYGRVEPAPPPERHGEREFDNAASQVVCRSQTLLIILHDQ